MIWEFGERETTENRNLWLQINKLSINRH